MDTHLDVSDFPDVDHAGELIAELEVHLSLHYPCLAGLPAERIPELRDIVTPIIRRWGEIGTGAGPAWVAGPFQGRSGAHPDRGAHGIEPVEAASLRALCGPVKVAGLPLGSSPAVEPIDDLFIRRPGWPAAEGGRW